MLISVRGDFRVIGDFDLDAQTDAVMDALLHTEEVSVGDDCQVTDSDVSASLTEKTVTLSVVIDADSIERAQEVGRIVFESAIQYAGAQIIRSAPQTMKPAVSEYLPSRSTAELVSA